MADRSSLKKRILSSLLITTLAAIVTFYFPNWAFTALASAMIGCALLEFFTLAQNRGIFVYKYFGILIGMLVPFIVYFQKGIEGYFSIEAPFIVIACLFTFVLLFIRRENSMALASASVTMFGLLYIAWLFSFFVKLKFLPHGALLVSFLILVTKMGDIGAYFAGRVFGKHPLIPRISPNKTIEGTIGGLILSVITALVCKTFLPRISYPHLLTLGILLGILAQVGDLAESLIKRDCHVKDASGNISGFGGLLDVIDSLLFTTPIFYFYIMVII